MGKKFTHTEYVHRVAEINPNIEILEEYKGIKIPILHKCLIHNIEWMVKPEYIVQGRGCSECIKENSHKTHKEYVEEVAKINPNIEVIGEYASARTKILHRCKIDGYEWYAYPFNIIMGTGCPKCANDSVKYKNRKTHDKYIKNLVLINPNIEVIDKYVNAKTKILHRCKICGYEWKVIPNAIMNGNGCPVCSGKLIGQPPEYQNSMWSSEYKDLFAKYFTEEQMKSYMPYSHKKINAICPECGRHKMIASYNVLKGFSCICGDGQSYPNKFMYAMLNQLKIEFLPEYSPDWANMKRYDIYIPSINCIIENHGMQHYDKGFEFIGGRTLEEEQENDKYKKCVANKHGIDNYIIIDCRKSTKEWIQQSVIQSYLPILLSFNTNSINWEECEKFAMSNLIKMASDLWNKNLTVKEIASKLKVSASTVKNYLRKADDIGWCNYQKKK